MNGGFYLNKTNGVWLNCIDPYTSGPAEFTMFHFSEMDFKTFLCERILSFQHFNTLCASGFKSDGQSG